MSRLATTIILTLVVTVTIVQHGLSMNVNDVGDTPIDLVTRSVNDCKEGNCDKKESTIWNKLTYPLELISPTNVTARAVNLALAGVRKLLKTQLAPYNNATNGLSEIIDKILPITDNGNADETTTTTTGSPQSLIRKMLNALRLRTADPDEKREAPEIISSRGFICQTHEIPTSDGYLLTTHRIVNPDYLSSDGHHVKTPKRPIILQHGVLASSVTFILNSPGGHLVDDPDEFDSNSTIFDGKVVGKNIGFELAKRGYDVWMPNHRGNVYSKANRKDVPTKSDWDFSFDQITDYDNPAIIDYVRNVTGRETVGYIAHSQGTLAMFGLLATQPKYNSIAKPFIALAPIGSMAHIKSIVKYFATFPVDAILRWKGEMLSKNALTRLYSSTVCATPGLRRICSYLLQSVVGWSVVGWSDDKQTNATRLPAYLTHFPCGTSGKNIVHFGQAVRTHVFSKYDYGTKENTEKYGTPKPPPYPFENITNPDIALFSADVDAFATPEDIEIFRNRLTVKRKIADHRIPEFNHLDFLLGKDAGVLVNAPALRVLSQYDSYP